MENAPLVSLSRAIGLMNEMDVVANNMANLNTTGYKSEKVLFEQYMMPAAADEGMPAGDQQVVYTQDWASIHDFSGGAMRQTGNPLDVALEGDGFLTINTPAGPQYTRNGEMHIDNNGTLVNVDGFPVASDGGTITFEPTETDISIAADGTVFSSAGNKGKLALASFASPQVLDRVGNNLFSVNNAGTALQDTTTRVHQGSLEASNVSGVTGMSDMIRVTRAYELVSQFIQQQDQLKQAAIQRLGNLA
jgi:flagellar basal-body rod protein FlgF